MTDTNQEKEDEVLKRMLRTPHKPHKDGGKPGVGRPTPDRSRKKPD